MYSTLKRCTLLLALVALAAATIVGCNGSEVAENPMGDNPTDPANHTKPVSEDMPPELVKVLSEELQISEGEVLNRSQEFVKIDLPNASTESLFHDVPVGVSTLASSWTEARRLGYGWQRDPNYGDWDVYVDFEYPTDAQKGYYVYSALLRTIHGNLSYTKSNGKIRFIIGVGPLNLIKINPNTWFWASQVKRVYYYK